MHFPVPKQVHDESSALCQFNTEFKSRYCRGKTGPNFSTMTFDKAVKTAFCGPINTRKPLGMKHCYFYYIYSTD